MADATTLHPDVPQTELPVDVIARLMSPEVVDDPAQFYAWLRDDLPVHRHHSGSYLVARHAEARWVFQSHLLRAPEPGDLARAFPLLSKSRSFQLLAGTVSMANPPVHTRLRRLVSRDFTVRMVDKLGPAMDLLCDQLLAELAGPLADGAVVDVHTGLARAFSLAVLAEMLGVDRADRDRLTPLVVRMLHATNPAATEAMLAIADEATEQVEDYYRHLVRARRAEPRHDLVSALIAAHDEDDRLDHDELTSMLWGFWAGGFETTAAAIGNAIIALLRNPAQAHWLRGGPAQVAAFVNESLRYDSPNLVSGIARIAGEDLELNGVTIPAGADVRPLPNCANRDPRAFADPDRFDPTRDTTEMVTFGHGIHYCLGAHLARAEVRTVLPRLHARFPALTLAEQPVRRRTLPLRTCDRIGVALDRS